MTMEGNTVFKTIGILIGGAAATEVVYQIYKYFKSRSKHVDTETNREETCTDYEVLFFPVKEIACKDHFTYNDGCLNPQCRFSHDENSLSRLYTHLSRAQSTLDVCVFVICCADLGDVLIAAHERGVRLRVICDNEQVDISGSQYWRLRKNGINVRTDSSSYLMHHKFVVIDGHTLINGSFNWTRQAISGNQENLMIIKHKIVVEQFKEEFDKLWTDFDPLRL